MKPRAIKVRGKTFTEGDRVIDKAGDEGTVKYNSAVYPENPMYVEYDEGFGDVPLTEKEVDTWMYRVIESIQPVKVEEKKQKTISKKLILEMIEEGIRRYNPDLASPAPKVVAQRVFNEMVKQ